MILSVVVAYILHSMVILTFLYASTFLFEHIILFFEFTRAPMNTMYMRAREDPRERERDPIVHTL